MSLTNKTRTSRKSVENAAYLRGFIFTDERHYGRCHAVHKSGAPFIQARSFTELKERLYEFPLDEKLIAYTLANAGE